MHPLWKFFGSLTLVALAVVTLSGSAASAAAATNVAAAQVACGTVDLASASSGVTATAFDCFTKAFAHCDFASLTATQTDGTASVSSTFVTFAGDNGCSISETVSRSSGSDGSVNSYVCNNVSEASGALHFTGCGAQREVWLKLAKS